MARGDQEVQERVARVDALLDRLESIEDQEARAVSIEAVQGLLELYGEGLARIVERSRRPGGEHLLEAFADDELVSHLLLLHGVHPIPVETRVTMALDDVRPYLQSHGGNVELVNIIGGIAHLKLQGSCNGCPASALTLKLAIEDAIQKRAPDVDGVEAEGASDLPSPRKPASAVASAPIDDNGQSAEWLSAGALPQLSGSGLLVKVVSGHAVLFLRVEDDYYAYRNWCPVCKESLDGSSLRGAVLTCRGCDSRYDVRRAGRGLDDPTLYLEPIPLLISDVGIVKIALPSMAS